MIETITIRPFVEQDYPAAGALSNAVYPDYPWNESEFRHEDTRYDGTRLKLKRLVADAGSGRLVGMAEYHHAPTMFHPRKLWIDLQVHPDAQGQGLGKRLYHELEDQMAPIDPLALWTHVRETHERGMRFAARRGFLEIRRTWESRLDVASFDPEPFLEQAPAGAEIVTVADEKDREPKWLERLYDLHVAVMADVPSPDTYTQPPLDDFVSHFVEHPSYVAEGHFLVKDGDRYVAESNLFTSEELPDVYYQGITGTRRDYRGQGLALALKLRTIDFARTRGIREIRTWNDSLNKPMLHINTALGFVRQPAWVLFEKRKAEDGIPG